jgi:hypothetical protein
MGLLILDDKHLADVPGTDFLTGLSSDVKSDNVDDNHNPYHNGKHFKSVSKVVLQVKRGRDHSKDLVLIPQPSESSRDPLNIPLWRKDFMFCIFVTNGAIVGAWSSMLSPAYLFIANEYGIVCV